jgi:hypothetical protein
MNDFQNRSGSPFKDAAPQIADRGANSGIDAGQIASYGANRSVGSDDSHEGHHPD